MLSTFKKYLLILLLVGFSAPATACSSDKTIPDPEIPPHIKPENPPETESYYPKAEGVTRLVTYNVGIFNKYIKDDYKLIANMMKEVKADIVCMNELDSCTSRTGFVDQLKYVSGLLGDWDYNYGAAMPHLGGKYGEGITSRDKAIRKFSVALEKGEGSEPRVLVVTEFEDFVIATTHLDHKSATAQQAQARKLNEVLKEEYGNSTKPVFLGGDMNAVVDSETMRLLRKEWTLLSPSSVTFPSTSPTKCIDHILQLNNGVKCEIVQSQVMTQFKAGDVKQASDHLPVMLDIKLPAKQ